MTEVFETDYWCKIGHFNHDQALKYKELCSEISPRYVIEVGFCTGRSSACVLYYTQRSLLKMISVDKDLDWKPHGREMAAKLQNENAQFQVLERCSHELLNEDFFEEFFPAGVDLATVDGDHSYDGCLQDLRAIRPYLRKGGLIVVDDYNSGPPNGVAMPEVDRAVQDFLDSFEDEFYAVVWNQLGKGFCLIYRNG